MTEKKPPSQLDWIKQTYRKSKNTESLVQDVHNALGVPKQAEKHLDPMEEELKRIGGILDSHNGQLQAIASKLDELNHKLQVIASAARGL